MQIGRKTIFLTLQPTHFQQSILFPASCSPPGCIVQPWKTRTQYTRSSTENQGRVFLLKTKAISPLVVLKFFLQRFFHDKISVQTIPQRGLHGPYLTSGKQPLSLVEQTPLGRCSLWRLHSEVVAWGKRFPQRAAAKVAPNTNMSSPRINQERCPLCPF